MALKILLPFISVGKIWISFCSTLKLRLDSLFHNHKIKLLTVNVIFNCNNQLSCYRVARAIAWLQLMTTFVHLRWYAVIQNNTWSRLQHEGVTICNSLSCSFQCQCCPPYLWIDMSLHQCTVLYCAGYWLNVNFSPRPALSFLMCNAHRGPHKIDTLVYRHDRKIYAI